MKTLQQRAEIEENVHKLTTGLRNGIDKNCKLNIFACLDQSGSIEEPNFYFIKKCLENLINCFQFNSNSFENSETVFGFLRFNNKVTLDQVCSNNKQTLITFLKDKSNMVYTPGGTQTGKALDTAKEELEKAQKKRPGSFNIYFLLTDDDLETGKQQIQQISKCNDSRLIVTFVNYVPPVTIYPTYGLKESYVVIFSSFDQLDAVFQEMLEISCSNPPKIENILACPNFIEIKFIVPNEPLRSMQVDSFEIEIQDEQRNSMLKKTYTYEFLPVRVEIDNKKFLQKKLLMNYRVVFKNSFLSKWSSEEQSMGYKELYIYDQLANISESFKLEVEEFTKVKHKPIYSSIINTDNEIPPRFKERKIAFLNIMFLGIVGAGKSSFINTMASIFAGKFKNICPHSQSNKSFTKVLKKVSIFESEFINCLDTFGIEFKGGAEETFENSNYSKILRDILSGRITPGFDLTNSDSPLSSSKFQAGEKFKERINTRIHSICLVVDFLSAVDKDYCKSLISFLDAINELDDEENSYQPVIVLTKSDIVFKNYLLSTIKQNNLNVQDTDFRNLIMLNSHSLTNDFKRFISNMEGRASEKNSFIFSNYNGTYEEPDVYKEYLGMIILKQLIDNAQLYVDTKYQKHYRVVFDNLFDKPDFYIGTVKLELPDGTYLTNVRTEIEELLEKERIYKKLKVEKITWRFLQRCDNDPIIRDDEKLQYISEVYFTKQYMKTIKITERINIIEDPNQKQVQKPQPQTLDDNKPGIGNDDKKIRIKINVYKDEARQQKKFSCFQELTLFMTLEQAKKNIEEFQEENLSEFVFVDNKVIPQLNEKTVQINDIIDKTNILIMIPKPLIVNAPITPQEDVKEERIQVIQQSAGNKNSKEQTTLLFNVNANLKALREFLQQEELLSLSESNDRFTVFENETQLKIAYKLEDFLQIKHICQIENDKKKVYILN